MIAMIEGAKRQKTPNEIALDILLAGLTIIFLLVVVTLMPFAIGPDLALLQRINRLCRALNATPILATQVIGDLRKNQDQAKETQKAMDDYAKEYTATQVNNFLDGKSDVDEYTSALEGIPREVQTTLTINENRVISEQHRMSEHEGKAVGGPMNAMQTYLTGEVGPELVTPTTASYVTPHDALQRAMASGAQLSSAAGSATTNNVSSSVTYQMPIYTNQSPAVLQQSLAIVEAMSA